MAASHAKSLLLIYFWLLTLNPALEPNNHTILNRIPSRWIIATQITQLGISDGDWNRKRKLELVMQSRGYHITIIARQLSTTSTFVCQAI